MTATDLLDPPPPVAELPRRGRLSSAQIVQLLKPINERRVIWTDGHAHLAQQDVRAHLIRILGFGNFDIEITRLERVFEEALEPYEAHGRQITGRYNVCYLATVRLTIRNEWGETVAVYEDGSTGLAQKQTRGEGHDLAMKSAISVGIKRAATNLGDQFGLSLYNKSQLAALVIKTLVGLPQDEADEADPDLQAGVEQQLVDGVREEGDSEALDGVEEPAPAAAPNGADSGAARKTWKELADECTTRQAALDLYERAVREGAGPRILEGISRRGEELARAESTEPARSQPRRGGSGQNGRRSA